jgi:hypothetical protein
MPVEGSSRGAMSFLEFLQMDEPDDVEEDSSVMSQSLPTAQKKIAASPRVTDVVKEDDSQLSFLEFLSYEPEPAKSTTPTKLKKTLSAPQIQTKGSGKVRRLLNMFEQKQSPPSSPTQPPEVKPFSVTPTEERKRFNRISIRFGKQEKPKVDLTDFNNLSASALMMGIGRANQDMSKIIVAGAAAENVREFIEGTRDDIDSNSDFPLPVEHEKLHALKTLLNDKKNGIPLLMQFAKSEYSSENVEAYLACAEVLAKSKKLFVQLKKQVCIIYDRYLKPQAFKEVNVSNHVREVFDIAMDDHGTDKDCIKALEQFQMYLLVNIVDTFTRLCKKEEYKQYCNNT